VILSQLEGGYVANSDTVVSVRIPEKDLREVQLIARVHDESVGSLIRAGVKKYVFELINAPGFREKATEMQRKYDETLKELFKIEDPTRSTTHQRKKK
jgi:hypothetical protein